MYADQNDDKLVNGDAEGIYTKMTNPANPHYRETPWVLNPLNVPPTYTRDPEEWAIENGALFPFCRNIKLYRCPTGNPGDLRTYAIVDAMNCRDFDGGRLMKKRAKILRPGERFIFVDCGQTTNGGWSVYYSQARWEDPPPVRHGEGANWSFADGHSEYWKWKDPRTYTTDRNGFIASPGNEDLQRVQRAAWGKMGYAP